MTQDVKKPFINGLVEGHIDSQVFQDILKTHAKESIAFIDFGNLSITNVDPRVLNRAQFTECEISPFHTHDIECDSQEPPFFSRQASTPHFIEKSVALTAIQQLLVHSFSPDKNNHRPYPSAGGLYPVEPLVFLFKERTTSQQELVSGAYHFRPISKTLQLIKKIPTPYFFDKLLHGLIAPTSHPSFALFYVAHLGKTIFKYRYRGYRHALMEAGSMYQQALITAQQMGLRSTAWSSFADYEMLYALDLDHQSYLPLTMQLFGYGGEE